MVLTLITYLFIYLLQNSKSIADNSTVVYHEEKIWDALLRLHFFFLYNLSQELNMY